MNDRFGTEVSKTSLNGSWKVSVYICSFEGTRKNGWIIPIVFLIVRAKPCLPLCSFSLIRKTELWETNKPPAMQVS